MSDYEDTFNIDYALQPWQHSGWSPQDELPHNWPPPSPASTQYVETSSTESEVEMDANESNNEYDERKRERDEMRHRERGEA